MTHSPESPFTCLRGVGSHPRGLFYAKRSPEVVMFSKNVVAVSPSLAYNGGEIMRFSLRFQSSLPRIWGLFLGGSLPGASRSDVWREEI